MGMSDATFGAIVSAVVMIAALVVLSVLFVMPHNLLVTGINEIYQNFGFARTGLGL